MSREELSQHLLSGAISESALVSENGSNWAPMETLAQSKAPSSSTPAPADPARNPIPPRAAAPIPPPSKSNPPNYTPPKSSFARPSKYEELEGEDHDDDDDDSDDDEAPAPIRRSSRELNRNPDQGREHAKAEMSFAMRMLLMMVAAIVLLAFGGFYFIAKVASDSNKQIPRGDNNVADSNTHRKSEVKSTPEIETKRPPEKQTPFDTPPVKKIEDKPAPPKDPPSPFYCQPFGKKEDAIAVICATKAGAQKTYLPLCTAFAIEEKTLCTRAYRLAGLGAFDRNATEPIQFVAIATDGVHEIEEFHLHEKFPLQKLKAPDQTDLMNMFVNDFALLTISGKMKGALGTAKEPLLATAVRESSSGELWAAKSYPETWAQKDRFEPISIPVAFVKHPSAPGGIDRFASVEGKFLLAMDGCPVLDSNGRVAGMMAMVFDQYGLRPGPQTVLSIERAHEMLAKTKVKRD